MNSTAPEDVICWLSFASTESASTFALEAICAYWMLTPKAASPAATVSVFASARFDPVAFTVTLVELVTLPSSSARTAPPMTARAANTPAARKPGAVTPSAVAIASLRRFVPFSSAFTSTRPLDAIDDDAPVFASTLAPLVTSAFAYAPLSPPSETLRIFASAFARFSAIACTCTIDEPVIVPLSCAVVSPETIAVGSITESATSPTLTPGAVATATLVASASTRTSPLVPIEPPVIVAVVARSSSARAIVRPPATAPVPTLNVCAFVPPCRPVAVTRKSPVVSGPCAPDCAFVVPSSVANATAPLRLPPTPAWTE